MYKFICILTIACSLTMTSCGGDGVDCDDETALSTFLNQAFDNYSDSFTAFGTDPSKANCEAVIKATEQYIDDIDSILDCIPSNQRAQFNQQLQDLRDELATAECE